MKTLWRPCVWLVLLACIAWRCGGGGGSSCSPGADVQGAWAGPVTSEVARGNPGTVTTSISQSDCTFGGEWAFTFEDPNLNKLFFIESGSSTESAVQLSIFQCNGFANSCSTVSTCSYEVTATLTSQTEMTGSYVAGTNCASFDQGTFDLRLVTRFTPSPVPTETAAPTPTPSP